MLKKIQSIGAISLVLTGMLLGIILVLTIPLVWAKDDNSILARLKQLEDKLKYYEERVTVTPNSNIGIGTMEPKAKLEINGTLRLSSLNRIELYGPAEIIKYDSHADNPISGADGILFTAHSTRSFIFGTYDGSTYSQTRAIISSGGMYVQGVVTAQKFNTGDIIFEKHGTPLWRMFEDEKGLYLQNIKSDKVYTFVLQEIQK